MLDRVEYTVKPATPAQLVNPNWHPTLTERDVRVRSLHTLSKHVHPVTALAFNGPAGLPGAEGHWLATASHDRVHVWNVKVRRFACARAR